MCIRASNSYIAQNRVMNSEAIFQFLRNTFPITVTSLFCSVEFESRITFAT